jgi:hypothetical protein
MLRLQQSLQHKAVSKVSLSEEHVAERDVLRARHVAARPRPRLLAHKRVLLLAAAVAAVGFDEEPVAMVRAQTACVLEEDVCLFLAHLAEDDDVAWVLVLLAC